MKKSLGVLIVVFLSGIILGAAQPAMLFAGQTGGGNIWDQFVYTKKFTGTPLNGALSIYYEYMGCPTTNCPDDCAANMFYMVKLTKQGDTKPYLFQGSSQATYPYGICIKDVLGQGAEIMNFFGSIVSGPTFFPNGVKKWELTAINNGQYNDASSPQSRAFVADVVITVQGK